MVIRILCSFISKHYPFKPFKLLKLANVKCLSRHNGFLDFPIQFVNAMCSGGPNVWLKFEAIIPKSLQGARLNELPTGTMLQLLYLSFGCIWPWGEWLCLFQVTRCLLSFLLNSPRIITLALSHIIAGGTPSCWKRRDNASLASLFSSIGNKGDQPKLVAKICAYLLPLLDTVLANNVPLYMLCSNLLYLYWQSFVLIHLDKDGCNTVQKPCCVVQWIILSSL